MAYNQKVLDYNKNPKNVGTLDSQSPHVGTGLVGAPACGDVMRLQIEVSPQGKIQQVKFKTYGCGSAIASSAWVAEWLKGKAIEEALTMRNRVIAEALDLPPIKRHCSILAEDAIRMAVQNYRDKQSQRLEVAQEV